MIQDRSPGGNWAGNYTYRAQKLHRPSMIEQLQEVIPNAPRVRVLGARYSFNDIAAKDGRVETAFELDHNAQSVLRTNRRRNVI